MPYCPRNVYERLADLHVMQVARVERLENWREQMGLVGSHYRKVISKARSDKVNRGIRDRVSEKLSRRRFVHQPLAT
jgi:hypothetical protein